MTDPNKPIRLQDLDIFDLLRLGHLSDEEKLKKMVQIQQIVFTNFINVDLPAYLSDENITELEKLSKKKDITPQEIEDFLRSKINDYDLIIAKKFLGFKKSLVKNNMQTRLNIAAKESEKIAEKPDSEEKAAAVAKLEKEKETLKAILKAIETGDWGQASQLIETL